MIPLRIDDEMTAFVPVIPSLPGAAGSHSVIGRPC